MGEQVSSRAGVGLRRPAEGIRERFAAGGALFGAVMSSACCILPPGLFMLGIGGTWIGTLTSLAPYEPFFLIPTLGVLAYGYWRVYGAPARACAAGTCARPLPRRLVEGSLWLSTVLVAAAAAFPWLAPVLLGL